MFSLQRFFCRDERFFDLIESLARSSTACVETLAQVLRCPEKPTSMDEIVRLRRTCKETGDTLAHELCVTFITPLEREDIEALENALLKISKTSEKFVSEYCIFREAIQHEDFKRQSDLIAQCAEILNKMVLQLRHKPDVALVKELNSQLRYNEGESDRILLGLIESLYTQKDKVRPVITVIATKNLQELMEKLTDRLRDAGNIVFRTVLKYA